MERICKVIVHTVFVAILILSFVCTAEATHCYIAKRTVRAADGAIDVYWRNIYQSPTPRVQLPWTIVGAWYNNTTQGGMNPAKCESMVRYKAQQNRSSAPLIGKCLRNYFNDVLVSSTCR